MYTDVESLAIGKAEILLRERGITELPVNPKLIAEDEGILVEPMPTSSSGVSGMLVRHGNNFGIGFATHIASPGFRNFSIAHELGHYFLAGHAEELFGAGDGKHTSRAGFTLANKVEREADYFAVGLLMPAALSKRVLMKLDDGLAGIKGLAEKCTTSLPATAIRYVGLTSIPAAIVVSTDGVVDYCFKSKALEDFDGQSWLKKGEDIPGRSLTARLVADQEWVKGATSEASETKLSMWFGGRGVSGTEEVIGLGRYGKALTVITSDFEADDEDEDDGELERSYEVRFKKR